MGNIYSFYIAHRGPPVSIVHCLFCQTIYTRTKIKAGILITIFYLAVYKLLFENVLISVVPILISVVPILR